jgi:hypothetical protein
MSPEECLQPVARVPEGSECGGRGCTGRTRSVPCEFGTRSRGTRCIPAAHRSCNLRYSDTSISCGTFSVRCAGKGRDHSAGRSRCACEERRDSA